MEQTTPTSMDAAVHAAIRQRAIEIANEEVERASQAILGKLHRELGGILAGVAKFYDMEMCRDRLVITVREAPND